MKIIFRAIVATTICLIAEAAIAFAGGEDRNIDRNRSQDSKIRGLFVDVASSNGAITRIRDLSSGIILRAPDGMAENFRLILQRSDGTTASIIGKDQKLSRVDQTPGRLSLRWEGPLRDTAGTDHDIAVRLDISTVRNMPDSTTLPRVSYTCLAESALVFSLHLENRTAYKVQEACYPMVGGLTGFHQFGKPCDATIWIPTSSPREKPISPAFGTASFGYPGEMCMSFVCIHCASVDRSLYFSSQDTIARYKTYNFTETADSESGRNVSVCIAHHPYTPRGEIFNGSPVVLKFVDGDWRACGCVYREWFMNAFGITQPSQCWIRRESFFLITMFMLPEGTINLTFRDIPRWAKAAKEHGIKAVMVSGWQMGGHDNGYPDYTPDPRLGTFKDLEDGIRACHQMGIRVYFFVNYAQMMVNSDWYLNDLCKYREMKADGGYTWLAGWGMGTLWARMGHPKNMTWADLSFPEFQKIIVDQFAKLAQIGADGVHVDKIYPSALDFNPELPVGPDIGPWEGVIVLSKKVMEACRKYRPDWAMSFECAWDRALQFTPSTWWTGNQSITRQVFPEHVETMDVREACDYLGVNNGVRNGHQIMVAPFGFSRGLDWPPFSELADYIKEVKRIRDSLQETVFWGEITGTSGLTIEGTPDRGIEYNVFRNRTTGRRVCVITNKSMEPGTVTIHGFDGEPAGKALIHAPFRKTREVMLPATIEIPAERITFVEETDKREVSEKANPPLTARPVLSARRSVHGPINGDFESGGFNGWTADPCWITVSDSRGYYDSWKGKYWAWSGGKGEAATGALTSEPFVLDKEAVRLLISGWNSIGGSGSPRKWNYVTLNLADGTEIDRVFSPNTTTFVPVYLDGSRHKGQKVYVQAVDDADQKTYSMMCIDDVRTADLPADLKKPVRSLPAFDPKRSIRLENRNCLVEISRANGSLTRIRGEGGLELILEPRLAGSFRFALPIPGKEPWQTIEANWIIGSDQKLSSYRLNDSILTLSWKGPLKNYLGEAFNVSVAETISLTQGGILFKMSIDNQSPYPVGEVYFPLIGGVRGLGTTRGELRATEMIRPRGVDTSVSSDIFKVFSNFYSNWLGDHGPERFYAYPADQPEPWFGFSNARIGRSVYLGAHDASDRKLVVRLELVPSGSGSVREDGTWPRTGELRGQPVGAEFSFVDIANFPVGRTYTSAPVFLKFLKGGSTTLRMLYTDWKAHDR